MTDIAFLLNGTPVRVAVPDPTRTLLDHLREDSIMVSFTLVGMRIELDFFEDHVEFSFFKGNEDVETDTGLVGYGAGHGSPEAVRDRVAPKRIGQDPFRIPALVLNADFRPLSYFPL